MESNNNILEKYNQLKQDYDNLLKDKEELEGKLKKYTAPERNKRYYEAHKEEVKKKVKEYKEQQKDKIKKTESTKEQRKDYNRRAYLKRKEQLVNSS